MEAIDHIDVLSSKGEILDPCSCVRIHLVLCEGGEWKSQVSAISLCSG